MRISFFWKFNEYKLFFICNIEDSLKEGWMIDNKYVFGLLKYLDKRVKNFSLFCSNFICCDSCGVFRLVY